ncbi:MAG TPA: hypothetical protein VFP96_08695 [Candidatus Acidoferrum sp.]|nr:hypothetical protein [Candidatus Acidoferrum sp.]
MQRTLIEPDLTFPHSYEVKEVAEFPGTGVFREPVFRFPRGGGDGNALWLRVKASSGQSWVGVFSSGRYSSGAARAVLSTPNLHRMCVLSYGNAYIVDAGHPETWERIELFPVLGVRPVVEHDLLLFFDFTGLEAYGTNGVAWKTPRLCWDDLKITNITANAVEGTGYDPTNRMRPEMRFAVDLKTGRSLLPSPFENAH